MVRAGGTPWNKGIITEIKIECKCGKKFFVSPSRKDTAKFCSQECYHKYSRHDYSKGKHWKLSKETRTKQGLSQTGKKNHNWNGGITNPRKNKEEKVWVRAVKKRDKFCVICGIKKIESHHLNGFDKFPKERYDVKNGVALCEKHHKEFHKKYGYGKNTKKQFEEFITEEIIDIETILMNKSTIYNLTLEGEDTFFANGIFTHNTPPHIIKPKDKKALKFKVGNGKVFAKVVKHPGTRPNPFIRNTIRNKLAGIIQEEITKQFAN